MSFLSSTLACLLVPSLFKSCSGSHVGGSRSCVVDLSVVTGLNNSAF